MLYCNIQVQKHDQDMNMWKRHRESENTKLVQVRNFYYLFEFKVFRYEERETQFLSMLTFPSDPTMCGTPLQTTGLASASSENRLPSYSIESQFSFFSNSKILSPSLPGMTSFTSPVSFPIRGFYCDIWDCHIHPVRAWTPAHNVCT